MPGLIDTKYEVNDAGDIVKSVDGTLVPQEMPKVLFLSKDKVLPELLREYKKLCEDAGSPEGQLSAIDELISRVVKWQESNVSQVKVPD